MEALFIHHWGLPSGTHTDDSTTTQRRLDTMNTHDEIDSFHTERGSFPMSESTREGAERRHAKRSEILVVNVQRHDVTPKVFMLIGIFLLTLLFMTGPAFASPTMQVVQPEGGLSIDVGQRFFSDDQWGSADRMNTVTLMWQTPREDQGYGEVIGTGEFTFGMSSGMANLDAGDIGIHSTVVGDTIDADVDAMMFELGLGFRYQTQPVLNSLVPYLGAGVTVGRYEVEASARGVTEESSDYAYGGYVSGGLGARFGESLTLDLGLSQRWTSELDFDGIDTDGNGTQASVGLRWSF